MSDSHCAFFVLTSERVRLFVSSFSLFSLLIFVVLCCLFVFLCVFLCCFLGIVLFCWFCFVSFRVFIWTPSATEVYGFDCAFNATPPFRCNAVVGSP